jgi:ankyrin repeat protein
MARSRRIKQLSLALSIPIVACIALGGLTYHRIRIVKMERPLIQAVEKSDEHAVKKLLAGGADPNSRDRPAQNTGFLAMLKKIIHKDASEHAENYNSVLMIAAQKSDTGALHWLLQWGADVKAKGPNGTTALLEAAAHDNTEGIRMLLDKGASIKEKDDAGQDALYLSVSNALANGWVSATNLLLDRGADAKTVYPDGLTALQIAADKDLTDFFQPLLAHHADPNVNDSEGTPILIREIHKSDSEAVKALLDHGADPNCTDGHINALTIIYEMLDGGYLNEYDSGDNPRRSPTARSDIFTALLAHGADPNSKDEKNSPLLLCAIHSERVDLVKQLLEAGSNPNIHAKGETPLMEATKARNIRMVSTLLDHRTEINGKDDGGATPLTVANYNGDTDIARLLKQHGAK